MTKTAVNTIKKHVKSAMMSRFINAEYKRGYMEGQHVAALELAEKIDEILSRYNHVSEVDAIAGGSRPR